MENFIVSARKYRPDTFTSVVGQNSITATLKNAIKNNHLGHAYLFSGPRGVGKTTCARIFAKTINCMSLTEKIEACNECESCKSFNESRAYNIHELDAASNNSVDDIRTLTEQVRIPPQVGTYSLYIIDEVHMLSAQAFNAFLKTLEEPPKHAIFILATTEKHKIIPTILSRCQIFDFNRIKTEDAVEYLKYIAGEEKITAEEEGLHVIAQKSEGAMRDALSIFDQVVSFSGDTITYTSVIENLNILDIEYYFSLTDAFLKNDISSVLLAFNEILEKGFDARNFINGLASHMRDLMVCRNPETAVLLDVGTALTERYLAQAKVVPIDFLYSGLEVCNDTDIQFRSSRNQRLTIELALVRLSNLSKVEKKKLAEPETKSEAKSESKLPDTKPQNEKSEAQTASAEVKPAPEEAIVKEKPVKESGKTAQITNGKMVHTKSISIKDSLKGASGINEPSSGTEPEEPSEEQKETTAGGETVPITQEAIVRAWNEYAESIKVEQPRIYNTLKHSQPVIDSMGVIKVELSSNAQKDNFTQKIKSGLVRYLQSKMGDQEYQVESCVVSNGEVQKKVYTDEDKMKFLQKKNPAMEKFKNSFNLDFDD